MRGTLIRPNRVKQSKIIKEVNNSKVNLFKGWKENTNKAAMYVMTSFALFFFVFAIIFITYRGINAFGTVGGLNWYYFITGNYYAPDANFYAGGLLMVNSIWSTLLSLVVAIPISVMTALFITRIVPKQFKTILFSLVALLAAVPSVIFGSFGANFTNETVSNISGVTGPLLSIVITLSMMIIPTITLITVSSINSVDVEMEQSSLALGATKEQTTRNVTFKAISSGILTGAILGLGRALGEASAVTMVAGESNWLPSFGLFENIRLITTTMLKGFKESTPEEQQYRYSLAMLLMIAVLVVFMLMKTITKANDAHHKEKVQAKYASIKRDVNKRVKNGGLESLDSVSQKNWAFFKRTTLKNKERAAKYKAYASYSKIMNDTTIAKDTNSYKKRKTWTFRLSTFVFAFLGIGILVAIITYLFAGGLDYLSWDFLTTRGSYEIIPGGPQVNGLAIPLLGTLIIMITTFAFVIPIGIFGGIYFGEYAKEGKVANTFIYGIELLTTIPSLIMGLIGFAIFVPLASAIGFAPLAGGLILTFITLPTVIKTTEESIKAVPIARKNGSLALGSTKSTSVWKIAIPEAMPGIMSGLLLSAGRMLGESAALIIIWGTWTQTDITSWISEGGTTLATEIYRLTGDYQVIPWDAIKAIGVVIMSIIVMLSLIANAVNNRNKAQIYGFSLSTVFIMISIFINIQPLFWIGVVILTASLMYLSIIKLNNLLEQNKGINLIPLKIQILIKRVAK